MTKFDVNDAVSLFAAQTANITSLWTVYVIATFAAAGFGLSNPSLDSLPAAVVTFAFLIFALGHLSLVRQALTVNRALRRDIRALISAEPDFPFAASLRVLARTANPPWASVAAHLMIDGCVIVAMWSRVAGVMAPLKFAPAT